MSVGYLTLGNDSATDVSVSRVTSPQFAAVEIHETAVIDGVARMRDVPELTIPANSSITLRSGGLHLMLMRPVTRSTEVRLSFYDGENLLLEATTNLKSRSQ